MRVVKRLRYFRFWYRELRWSDLPEFADLSLRQRLELSWKWSYEAVRSKRSVK